MAEQCPFVAGEHGSEPTPVLTDAIVPDRERLAVKPVEAARSQPPRHRLPADPESHQLASPDHAVLPGREARNRLSPHLTSPPPRLPTLHHLACPSFCGHMDA